MAAIIVVVIDCPLIARGVTVPDSTLIQARRDVVSFTTNPDDRGVLIVGPNSAMAFQALVRRTHRSHRQVAPPRIDRSTTRHGRSIKTMVSVGTRSARPSGRLCTELIRCGCASLRSCAMDRGVVAGGCCEPPEYAGNCMPGGSGACLPVSGSLLPKASGGYLDVPAVSSCSIRGKADTFPGGCFVSNC